MKLSELGLVPLKQTICENTLRQYKYINMRLSMINSIKICDLVNFIPTYTLIKYFNIRKY